MLCSLLSVVADQRTFVALPIALLAAFALLCERGGAFRRRPVVAVCAEAAFAGTAVALSGDASSPLLPYLLAPGVALGLNGTWRHVLEASVAAVVGLAVGRQLEMTGLGAQGGPTLEFVVSAGQWVGLGLALGLVAAWSQRLVVPGGTGPQDRYGEARQLLEQLRRVTRRLPGGLDVPSSAEALLERCTAVCSPQRSAVLVQPGSDVLVPVAVRGTQRVPWRAPLSEPGPLRDAWETRLPVVDRRKADSHGRRRGSSLAVLPLVTGEEPFGLVVLESFDPEAFSDAIVADLQAEVVQGALRLETALLFEEVRSTVTVEERDRLAREMHDGVAQELAFVGYQLDDLRLRAAKVDDALAEQLTEVRKGLTRLISDIRLSITDLKTSVGADRGLGAAITGYLRAVGSGQRVAVHVSLKESTFRLPGESEVVLFQVAQAVAQDVRRSGRAGNLWVTLDVDPPSARLLVEHDGEVGDVARLDLSEYSEHLTRLGGTLSTGTRPDGGITVEAVLEGGSGGGARSPGR